MNLKTILLTYLEDINLESIYNEASLQFEIGYLLKGYGFSVKFEVNIASLPLYKPDVVYTKKEIDLVVFKGEQIVGILELKAPMLKRPYRQQRESKHGFNSTIKALEKDIIFLHQVKSTNIEAISIFFTDDQSYYQKRHKTQSNLDKFRSRENIEIRFSDDKQLLYTPKWRYPIQDLSRYNFFITEI